jgi:hypothetical protein
MARLRIVVLPFVLAFVCPFFLEPRMGWWLDSGRGVAFMMVVLGVLGAIFALASPARPWPSAWAVIAGAFFGSAILLFSTGPGTIWPIVLVVALSLSTTAALAGAAVVYALRLLRYRFR